MRRSVRARIVHRVAHSFARSPGHLLVTGPFFWSTELEAHDVGISRQTLVPVSLAARMLYQRVHGAVPPQPHLAERLNGLAYRLARLGCLYSLEGKRSSPRRLSPDEIAGAYFRHGATELHFLDARPPLAAIGVTRECIEAAARVLLAGEEEEEEATRP